MDRPENPRTGRLPWVAVTALCLFVAPGGGAFGQDTNDRVVRLPMSRDRQDSTLSAALADIARDSTKVENYEAALKVYKDRGQYIRMMSISAKMVKINPASALAQYLYGDAMLDNGDPETAIAAFKAALGLDRSFVRAHVALAESYGMMKHIDSAIAQLDTALMLNPRYAQAFLQRGALLVREGRLKEAAADYRNAADLLTSSFEPWMKAGRASLEAGLYEDAIEALSYARQLNPGSPNALLLLGDAYAGKGELETAYQTYEEFLYRFPLHAYAAAALQRMCWVYQRMR